MGTATLFPPLFVVNSSKTLVINNSSDKIIKSRAFLTNKVTFASIYRRIKLEG